MERSLSVAFGESTVTVQFNSCAFNVSEESRIKEKRMVLDKNEFIGIRLMIDGRKDGFHDVMRHFLF